MMKWMLSLATGMALSIASSVAISDDNCNTEDGNICRMAEFIASIMDQVPGDEDNLSVTASGNRVSYSVITGMTRSEVDASPVDMYDWASDAQEAMCSTQLINSFIRNGGELWYGLKGKDFELSLLELRCRKI